MKDKITQAQILAGEQAVIANLKSKGLIPDDNRERLAKKVETDLPNLAAALRSKDVDMFVKNRCQYELIVEEYFGIKTPSSEDEIFNVEYYNLVNLVCHAHQKLTDAAPTPTEEQDREVKDVERTVGYEANLNEYLEDGINYFANTIRNTNTEDLKQLASDSFHSGAKFMARHFSKSTPSLPVGELNKMADGKNKTI